MREVVVPYALAAGPTCAPAAPTGAARNEGVIVLDDLRHHDRYMPLTTTLDLAAWSTDGGVAFLSHLEHAEGDGERRSWVIVNAAGARVYTLSSTLTPEGGATPETVAERECRAVAKDLSHDLASFDGVRVRPERCANARGDVVEVDTTRRALAAASWTPEDTVVRRAGKRVRVIRKGEEVEVLRIDHRPREVAWASVGPVVLVLERATHGDLLLAAVVQTPTGMFTVELGEVR